MELCRSSGSFEKFSGFASPQQLTNFPINTHFLKIYSMFQHIYFSATIPYAGNAWGSGDLCSKEGSIFWISYVTLC